MLLSVLLALTVIMLTARLVGALFAKLNQPAVIGEVVGGILLGPSLLGRLAPGLQALLLPADAAPFLGVIAQLGVILYMFLVGLELDLGLLRSSVAITIAISLPASSCRSCSARRWRWRSSNRSRRRRSIARRSRCSSASSMSITAFPVLARILGDRGLQRTPLGTLALTCAAINDVTAWCLLAFVVSVMQATPGGAIAHRRADRALHRA